LVRRSSFEVDLSTAVTGKEVTQEVALRFVVAAIIHDTIAVAIWASIVLPIKGVKDILNVIDLGPDERSKIWCFGGLNEVG